MKFVMLLGPGQRTKWLHCKRDLENIQDKKTKHPIFEEVPPPPPLPSVNK